LRSVCPYVVLSMYPPNFLETFEILRSVCPYFVLSMYPPNFLEAFEITLLSVGGTR
jgi:hypothetical protein